MFPSTLRRRAATLATVFYVATIGVVFPQQGGPIKLFKIITPKDEVTIGLTADELRSFGPRPDIENLAKRLASAGQITVWQYAVGRGADGALAQKALRRVSIFKTDTLRIEPFDPAPMKILPPDPATK